MIGVYFKGEENPSILTVLKKVLMKLHHLITQTYKGLKNDVYRKSQF